MTRFDRVWFWKPQYAGVKDRKGLRCRVLFVGRKNSALIELEDGELVVASRYAVRRLQTSA